MVYTLQLFAHLADVCKSPTLHIEEVPTVAALRKQLLLVPALSTESFAIAVNRKIVHDEYELSITDEIALLPPFSGG